MNSQPNPARPSPPSGRDTLPPSGWRQAVAAGGGALAGCGLGTLLLVLLVLLLWAANLGSIIAGFFYGGAIFELPIAIAFLLVLMGVGAWFALQQHTASRNRVPPLAITGYSGAVLVVVIAWATIGHYQATEARNQKVLLNNLRQQYGYLYYPNALPDPSYAGRIRTTDSYQKVTRFYAQLPLCDATKVASGGGSFILPCHAPGGAPASRIYLRINSRVANNTPYLLIDTTNAFEW